MVALVIWAVIAVVCVILEVLITDLAFLIVGIAAAGAGVSSLFGAPIWLQILIFAVLTAVGLLGVRPSVLRRLGLAKEFKTNIDAIPGSRARTLDVVTVEAGLIRLNGQSWSARVDRDGPEIDPIPTDVDVIVTRIDGATALVQPFHNS
ncbi:MAG: NfeD family protein [Actinomycetota bacterium]|nr:NfeD family protein [Actinomycetota bacterium]